ncbi:alpha/beta-hydrolase [Cystobasidium minutum MCA 4210]|uniref:alpha/beta-hydrolase n=1 Tax=Cystobasidium minutum MCA 4210 TaxID=1397322 RepID=UPI0034CF8415|eukprot:jgi/Rhomi1/207410/estExt_Genemark1.C_1_t10307
MKIPVLVDKVAKKAAEAKEKVQQKVEAKIAEKKEDGTLDSSKIGAILRAILFVKGPIRAATAYTDLAQYKDIECMVKNWRIPHKTDNLELGAWHYLPAAGTPSPRPAAVSDELSRDALRCASCIFRLYTLASDTIESYRNSKLPVILFLHGLGSDRASGNYRRFGNMLVRHDIQSLHLDYRGYGDSTKLTDITEEGVISDAMVALQWLEAAGVSLNNITVVGYSLGTGIAAALVERLRLKGRIPRALVLVAAYTSIADVLTKYRPGGVLPIGRPLGWHPGLKEGALTHLNTPLNTISILPNVTCPILLVHARSDRDLECDNSARLFQAVLGDEKLPEQLKQDFTSTEIGSKNYLRTFLRRENRLRKGDQWPVIEYLETEKGKHVEILHQEETLLAIQTIMSKGWRRYCKE